MGVGASWGRDLRAYACLGVRASSRGGGDRHEGGGGRDASCWDRSLAFQGALVGRACLDAYLGGGHHASYLGHNLACLGALVDRAYLGALVVRASFLVDHILRAFLDVPDILAVLGTFLAFLDDRSLVGRHSALGGGVLRQLLCALHGAHGALLLRDGTCCIFLF